MSDHDERGRNRVRRPERRTDEREEVAAALRSPGQVCATPGCGRSMLPHVSGVCRACRAKRSFFEEREGRR